MSGKAFVICGPESSGNRLVAAIFCRSGCGGEGSTNQPQSPAQLPPANRDYVIIKHTNLTKWVNALKERGFESVTAILVIREPIANVRSMIARGHRTNAKDAYESRTQTILQNVREIMSLGIPVEIITYEGLTESFLAAWLPRLGLPYVSGPLSLPGQRVSSDLRNQNSRHY